MAASLVQKLGTNSGAAPKTITIPASGVPIGDLIVVFLGNDSASSPTSITDTGSNTYLKAIDSLNQTGASLWYSRLTVALVSGNTVSVNGYTGSSAIGASQFTGIAPTPIDKTASANAASGTSLTAGTTAAISQASELHVACWGLNINGSVTQGIGFTLLDSVGTATVTMGSEYKILTVGSGGQIATATGSATSAWDGVQATFKATLDLSFPPPTHIPFMR